MALITPPHCHRGRGRPKNTWKRNLEKEIWTAGYKYSWRKTEVAVQNRAGCGKDWPVAYISAKNYKSSKSTPCTVPQLGLCSPTYTGVLESGTSSPSPSTHQQTDWSAVHCIGLKEPSASHSTRPDPSAGGFSCLISHKVFTDKQTQFLPGCVSVAGNRQLIPTDPLPAVSYK